MIAKVDADAERDLGERFGVQGFPTLKFFPAGKSSEPVTCSGRELDNLVECVNTNAGTFRATDGSLLESAGRIDMLDAMVSGATIDSDLITNMKATSAKLQGSAAKHAAIYISIAEKVIEKGKAYIESETKRITGFLSSKSISAAKKIDFATKRNIIKAFA